MGTPSVTVFGRSGCHKTEFYRATLLDKSVTTRFVDVDEDPEGRAELLSYYDDDRVRIPTLVLDSGRTKKRLRNPRIADLEKWLATLGIDPHRPSNPG